MIEELLTFCELSKHTQEKGNKSTNRNFIICFLIEPAKLYVLYRRL